MHTIETKPSSGVARLVQRPFVDLPIGARFRLPAGSGYVGGIYVKTSPVSYGKRAGETLWDITGKPFQVEPLNDAGELLDPRPVRTIGGQP